MMVVRDFPAKFLSELLQISKSCYEKFLCPARYLAKINWQSITYKDHNVAPIGIELIMIYDLYA